MHYTVLTLSGNFESYIDLFFHKLKLDIVMYMKDWKLNNIHTFLLTGVILLFVLVQYGISYYPLYKNSQLAPVDVFYLGTTEYPIDLFGNLSSINDGMKGIFVRISKITTAIPALNAPFVKFEYVAVGRIAGILGLHDVITVYYAYRLLLSALFIGSIYFIISNFIPAIWFRLMAFGIALFAAGITYVSREKQIWDMMFGDGIVFGRTTTAMPHYFIGSIVCLLLLYLFDSFIRHPQKRVWKIVGLVFLTFWGSLVNVTSLVIPVISTGVVAGWLWIRKKLPGKQFFLWVVPMGLSFIVPSLYLMYVGKFWDFSMFSKTEKLWSIPFTPSLYFDAVGLVYVLSFLSIPGIVKRGRAGEWAMLLWLVLHPFMVFFGSDLLNFNSVRMFYVPQYVVFSVLATLGLRDLYVLVRQYSRIGAIGLVGLALGAVIWSSWGTYRLYYEKTRVSFGSSRWPYPYGAPKKTVYEALLWLRDNTNGESVLSGYHSGTMIPGIAGNFVYTSWWLYLSQDPRLGEILKPHLAFWYREMTDAQAQEFLQKNGIRYIFFGPEEKGVPRIVNPGVYPFLTRVFTNGDVEIFEYKK